MDKPILLVLGGGLYQLPVVRAARAAGLSVAVVDRSHDVPARNIADLFESVDTRSFDAIAEFAARIRISGVIAPCTDTAVPTQAYVANKLRLPGPPVESAEILSDKVLFRRLVDRLGLPTPSWQPVHCGHPTNTLLNGRRYILKPAASSGSKGAFIVNNKTFARRVRETQRFCINDRAILEEFIEGQQGTVEGLRLAAEFGATVFTDRMTASPPYVATTGHQVPSHLSAERQQEILHQIALIFTHLSVSGCPFDCDFVVGPQGPRLIELSPRLGGNSLSKLLMVAAGVDLISNAISLSLKPDARGTIPATSPDPLRDVRAAAIILFGADCTGLLDYDESALAELKRLDWVEEITFDIPKGALVNNFINGRERVGEALITADSRQLLDQRIKYVKERLAIFARPVV
jgi:biotin carboxylase